MTTANLEMFTSGIAEVNQLHPFLGPIAFVILQVFMAILFLPCSPLTILTRALWGAWYGFLISITATIFSMAVTFGLSRRFCKERIEFYLKVNIPRPIN